MFDENRKKNEKKKNENFKKNEHFQTNLKIVLEVLEICLLYEKCSK